MATIKDFLIESKAFDQLNELESLWNDGRFERKLYSAKESIFARDKKFTVYIFFLKNGEQHKVFYIKSNFLKPGNIFMEEDSKNAQFKSFEPPHWELIDPEAQITI